MEVSYNQILRIFFSSVAIYFCLIFLIRFFGKRSLGKWNSFDFVMNVAMGSIVATTLLSKDVELINGVIALFTLIFLQFMVTWTSVRSQTFTKLLKSEPTLLFYNGEFIQKNMKKERVAESEVYAAIREQGDSSIENVGGVVLETDGNLSVILGEQIKRSSPALEFITGWPEKRKSLSPDEKEG